jgi:hypothetical protein
MVSTLLYPEPESTLEIVSWRDNQFLRAFMVPHLGMSHFKKCFFTIGFLVSPPPCFNTTFQEMRTPLSKLRELNFDVSNQSFGESEPK